MHSSAVTVLLPAYNGKNLLEKNLDSYLTIVHTGDELLIIDDASTDETLQWLIEKFSLKLDHTWFEQLSVPEQYHTKISQNFGVAYRGTYERAGIVIAITVFKNSQNVRFGASVNVGFLLARTPWVLLCNTDVVPFAECIDILRKYTGATTIFGVGCLEYEGNEKVLGGKNKLWFARGLFQHSRADSFETGETAWVSGGSGFFNRNKWLMIGGFDPIFYPAYWEDVDISFQAKKHGWDVLFDAAAKVTHNHETTNTSVFGVKKITRMSWKNALIFTWKNASPRQRISYIFWLPYWLLQFSRN